MNDRHCDQVLEFVYQYLDAELTWLQRRRVQWHLRRCHPCTGMYYFEERLRTTIREKSAEPPPVDLIDRLRTVLRDQPPAL